MKIEIKEEKDTVTVLVKVKLLSGKNKVRERVSHRDVINHLSQQGVKVGACISKPHPAVVSNRSGKKFSTGKWVFEKPKSESKPKRLSKPKSKKTVQTRKKSKKVEKTLDKSQEDVIIEVQEKTLSPKEE